jgi:hypothetical protein
MKQKINNMEHCRFALIQIKHRLNRFVKKIQHVLPSLSFHKKGLTSNGGKIIS